MDKLIGRSDKFLKARECELRILIQQEEDKYISVQNDSMINDHITEFEKAKAKAHNKYSKQNIAYKVMNKKDKMSSQEYQDNKKRIENLLIKKEAFNGRLKEINVDIENLTIESYKIGEILHAKNADTHSKD